MDNPMTEKVPPLFFWQNMPTHHQAASLDELARLWPAEVTGVWGSRISDARRRLGWAEPATTHLRHRYLTSETVQWKDEIRKLADDHREAIHIFSGIGAYAPATYGFSCLSERKAPRLGLIVEKPIMLGWRRHVRHWKTKLYYRGHLAELGCVFAMGSAGMDYYSRIGFSAAQLFPFFYQEDVPPPVFRALGDPLKLVYAGQINFRKGLDTLIRALPLLRGERWTLTIYGDGPDREGLEREVRHQGLADRVAFKGNTPASALIGEFLEYDLCIVPSRFDGWGMVVNEALQSGVAVLASDRTASSDLVRSSGAGAVFAAADHRRLAELISERLLDRTLLAEEKKAAVRFAPRIAPSVAAGYLRDAFRHAFLGAGERPVATWLSASECG
jgi:glycosyltransferase involved in cell wall biosynthesis